MDQNNPVIQKGLRLCFIFLLTAAGLGEWKTLNNMLGGLPKAITVGIICSDYSICDHFSGSETLQTAERTYAVLHVPDHSSAFVIHGDLDFEFYESLLHDPGLFQGDLPEHCDFDGTFRCVFVWCRSSGSVCGRHVPGKRGDHGIGDSILWYCSEYTVLITCLVTFGDAEGAMQEIWKFMT